MKFFPKINKISRVERTSESIGRNFGSLIIFNKMFWKIFIFAYAVDLISKAIIHRFYDYLICYDGEYCDRQSIFIRWIFDGQLYLSHVKHGYRNLTDRIMMGKQEWEARLLNWASNHIENYFDYNIPDLYFYYVAPMIVFLLWGLLVTSGRNKDSTKLIAIGVALYCAGGLGNRTELFLFGWATDFIGIPKDSLIDSIPKFISPLGPSIANLADFFLVIGRILFIIGLFNVKDYKRKAIPLPRSTIKPNEKLSNELSSIVETTKKEKIKSERDEKARLKREAMEDAKLRYELSNPSEKLNSSGERYTSYAERLKANKRREKKFLLEQEKIKAQREEKAKLKREAMEAAKKRFEALNNPLNDIDIDDLVNDLSDEILSDLQSSQKENEINKLIDDYRKGKKINKPPKNTRNKGIYVDFDKKLD